MARRKQREDLEQELEREKAGHWNCWRALQDLLEQRPYISIKGCNGLSATIHRVLAADGGQIVIMSKRGNGGRTLESVDYLDKWLATTEHWLQHATMDTEAKAYQELYYAVRKQRQAALDKDKVEKAGGVDQEAGQ